MQFLPDIKKWLASILIITAFLTDSQAWGCEDNEYYSEAYQRCCSLCQPGTEQQENCTETTDTLCIKCPQQTFSGLRNNLRICLPCTHCSPARITTALCSPTEDTHCGSCSSGYFLYVSSSGPNQCLKCSPCPKEGNYIHWEECKIVGLPDNVQCKPGLVTIPDDSGFNRSSFIPQNNGETLHHPEQDSPVITGITSVTIIAGVAAMCFFSTVFTIVSYRICNQERAPYQLSIPDRDIP